MALNRLLVTGAGGFVGSHLLRAIARDGIWEAVLPPQGWDIRDRSAVMDVVSELAPHAVIHLAAQSSVPRSFDDPAGTFEINALGTLNLLAALKATGFKGRLLYVSSADVYGLVPEGLLPADESTMPSPRNPYAASKLSAEIICHQWARSEGIEAIVARPFNHIGPGQSSAFVVPALTEQLAAISADLHEPVIYVGDIDSTRDFTDVRDVVDAYLKLLSGQARDCLYVVGSGVERSVRSLLDRLCVISGVYPEIRVDANRLRKAEQRRMCCDAGLIRDHHGWLPRIDIDSTLNDIFNEAKSRLK